MNTLYLTSKEQSLYKKLPASVQDGWVVEEEKWTYADSSEKQLMRLSLVRLHDPSLLNLREKALSASSMKEVAELMQKMDLRLVDEDDLAELCFALGPDTLSQLIAQLLSTVKVDSDLEGATALSVVRHSILHSLQHS